MLCYTTHGDGATVSYAHTTPTPDHTPDITTPEQVYDIITPDHITPMRCYITPGEHATVSYAQWDAVIHPL